MPFFPEGLYTLRPKDREGIQLEPFIRFTDFGQLAAAALQDDIFFPSDRAIILQHVFVQATPGAGQNVTDIRIAVHQRFVDTSISILRAQLAAEDRDFPVAVIGWCAWTGSILLPTSGAGDSFWHLRVNSSFNAGAAANNHVISIYGVLIPPGNLPIV